MNLLTLRCATSVSALGLILALALGAIFAQANSNVNRAVEAGNDNSVASRGKPVDDGLPKKKPETIRHEDGSATGDAALGIALDEDVPLPTADKIKRQSLKHEVKRGKVDRDVYTTGPQQTITKLR